MIQILTAFGEIYGQNLHSRVQNLNKYFNLNSYFSPIKCIHANLLLTNTCHMNQPNNNYALSMETKNSSLKFLNTYVCVIFKLF